MSLVTRAYSALTKRDLTTDLLVFMGLPYGFGSSSLSKMQALQLPAVYRCTEILGDAIASVTREAQVRAGKGWVADKDSWLWQILNLEPNPVMSAYTMWKLAIVKMLLEGNAYIEIIRDFAGMPIELNLILDPVKILQDDTGVLYYVIQTGKPRILEQSNVVHLMNFSYDGLIGVSTLTHANNTLTLYDASEKHAKNYFYGGANGGAIVKVNGRMDATRAAAIKADFAASLEPTSGSPNSVVVTGNDMDIMPWPSIPPKDAQMLEGREFTVVDICRFFGVDPTKVYHTKDSKYNTVESMQLAFATDTVGPLFAKIESELNRKLFIPSLRTTLRIRFDEEELLRADLDSRANYRLKQFQVGTYTVDDNREAAGKPPFETDMSSTPWVQTNMQPINKFNNDENRSKKPDNRTKSDQT